MMGELKEFMKALAFATVLGCTIIMLWIFYNIYVAGDHWADAKVLLGEPNALIFWAEVALMAYGVIFTSIILFKDHCKNIKVIEI